jgi:hypothetical protein
MSVTAFLPADIEALADSLSDSADALHKRIMRAIRQNDAAPGQSITHAEAQALFEQEVMLRQQANTLYADAVRYASGGLAVPGRELLELAARARDRIRRIDRAKELAGVAAALLGAAAAVASRRPEGLAPALEALKAHLEALQDTDTPASTRHTMDT